MSSEQESVQSSTRCWSTCNARQVSSVSDV